MKNPRTIVLIGGPGSGKGTQGRAIISRFELPPVISTGDLFREMSKSCHSTTATLTSGSLMNDTVVKRMVKNAITKDHRMFGFVLDGYPRTLLQAGALDAWEEAGDIPPLLILHLEVPRGVLSKRLEGRRQCSQCRRLYHIEDHPPRITGVCDDDGQQLIQRADDKPNVIQDRLRIYEASTKPILDQYKGCGCYHLHDVRGDQHPEKVTEQIFEIVSRYLPVRQVA